MTSTMTNSILLSVMLFLFCSISIGQSPRNKVLYLIDSIPILTDPEEWNPILQEDIADFWEINSKDTLSRLGYENIDGVTYIFTKEYRKRPDSLKLIPSLKQMKINGDVWNLNNIPYSGRYLDYFNSGKIQSEGTLLNGKLNGELVVYFKNGNKKSVSNYKNEILEGVWNDYYTNGSLLQTREFFEGKEKGFIKMYFINGQIQSEIKSKQATHYDTVFTYYSTGNIKEMQLIRNNKAVFSKKKEDINYYTTFFNMYLNAGNIKKANKAFFKIMQLDDSSIDTYFLGGLLHLTELHFEKAIAEFDKALMIEPMMRQALVHRALARIKKNQYLCEKLFSNNSKKVWILQDLPLIPKDELNKICSDIKQAAYLDFSDFYVKKIIPELFFNYCSTTSSR